MQNEIKNQGLRVGETATKLFEASQHLVEARNIVSGVVKRIESNERKEFEDYFDKLQGAHDSLKVLFDGCMEPLFYDGIEAYNIIH